jgi:hypothetical protein
LHDLAARGTPLDINHADGRKLTLKFWESEGHRGLSLTFENGQRFKLAIIELPRD